MNVPAVGSEQNTRSKVFPADETVAARARFWEIAAAIFCIVIALYTTIYPIFRASLLVEVSYNEGWNAFNAETLARHLPLYAARYGWTTVNYPFLSFYVIAQLSRFTHDFLFTGRALSILSLAVSGLLVGMIVRKLTGKLIPSVLAGFFLIGVFCANADTYVGADDPQLFAQMFFIGALLVYVSRRQSIGALAVVAFLFVLGGSIKHNMIDIPFAVMLDLALVSRKRLVQFCLIGAAFLSVAIFANISIGGPYFVAQLLTPRLYSVAKIGKLWLEYYPLILVPFILAGVMAVKVCRSASLRILSLLFGISLALGMAFSGGSGVAINTYFSNTVSISILLGILFAELPQWSAQWPHNRQLLLRTGVPVVMFAWLGIPLACNEIISPVDNYQKLRSAESRFEQQVAFLRAQPGPVICENLLRCYAAEKPYVYDPFNSTSLILAGKLDGDVVVNRIRNHEYAAIQLSRPPWPNGMISLSKDRFVDPVLDAIASNYHMKLSDKDCAIYVPKHETGH